MGKLTCSLNLSPRSNKLAIATSCVGEFLDPRLNRCNMI